MWQVLPERCVFPVADLLALCPVHPAEVEQNLSSPAAVLAARLSSVSDVSPAGWRQRVIRWGERGGLMPEEADQAAVLLGLHPSDVWSGWWLYEEAVASA